MDSILEFVHGSWLYQRIYNSINSIKTFKDNVRHMRTVHIECEVYLVNVPDEINGI